MVTSAVVDLAHAVQVPTVGAATEVTVQTPAVPVPSTPDLHAVLAPTVQATPEAQTPPTQFVEIEAQSSTATGTEAGPVQDSVKHAPTGIPFPAVPQYMVVFATVVEAMHAASSAQVMQLAPAVAVAQIPVLHSELAPVAHVSCSQRRVVKLHLSV